MIRKGWLIPICAVVLMFSSGISAYAAEGWAQSGGNWSYYNAKGDKVTNAWKKGADDKWRWLDDSGEMAINTWVDDIYYVDNDGIMMASTWKKIDSKYYYFDDNGHMMTGWILEDTYYCGSDGVMKTGWIKLQDPDSVDNDDDDTPAPFEDDMDSDDVHWYYFQSTGKVYKPNLDNGAEYGERKVDGKRYVFDEYGAMQTGWVNLEGTQDSNAVITDYKYYNSDGSVRTGWYSLEPPEDMQNNYDNDVVWFYFSSTGEPKAADGDRYTASDIVKVNGKSYLFNQYGTLEYGLQKVYTTSSSDTYNAYYFGKNGDFAMEKGKKTVEEGDGDTATYYFSDNGKGHTGVKDSHLYYLGKLQEADEGTKYQVISVPSGNGYSNYVVSPSGKIAKNTTVKDADGVKYTTNSGGILTKIDEEPVKSGETFEAVEEPVFGNND